MTLPRTDSLIHQHLIALQAERERPAGGGLRVRASSAGKCARAIGFQVLGIDATNPPGPDSLVNFYVGDRVHDLVQAAVLREWPDAETEKQGWIEDWLIGHSDVLYRAEDGELVVLEIKSVADFGFEKATGVALKSNGRWKKKEPDPPEGPKKEFRLQACIYAIMHDAAYVAIVYVRKTAAKNEPVTWEWRFRREELEAEAREEIDRLKGILEMVKSDKLPARIYDGKEIDNPAKTKWPCDYCQWVSACVKLGTGEIEIK